MPNNPDYKFLKQAIEEAQAALNEGNNPIGCLIVDQTGQVIAKDHNQTKTLNDATAHGEILSISAASELVLERNTPEPTTLYTTLEPCFACSFFISRTNIRRVVWAYSDPYKGGMNELATNDKMKQDISLIELVAEPFGDLRAESMQLMRNYYLLKGDQETANVFT